MVAPSLSIVITSLNRVRYIERTILSILRQQYAGRVQVIVADGGSTDGTVDILKHYTGQITWWSGKDGGIVDALRKGVAAADGEFLALQDSDNFYLPDAFTHTIEAFDRRPELAVATGCDVYLEEDGVTFSCSQLDDHDITPRSLLMRRVIPIHCAFIRRSVYDTLGGVRELSHLRTDKGDVGNCGIDIDLWYRLLHSHAAAFVPWHTCVYQHHSQMMSRNTPSWYSNLVAIVENGERDPVMGAKFKLNDFEKKNLYIRWEISQCQMNGDTVRVRELAARVERDHAQYTDETRDQLRLHGFLPKQKSDKPKVRHANHRDHDMHWWTEAPQTAARAA